MLRISAVLAMWLFSGAVAALTLPPQLQISAHLSQASVPACPKETASKLALTFNNNQLTGHLAQLSLDLTCSNRRSASSQQASASNSDALSLLFTLPDIDFQVDELTLHLPSGSVSGPAVLRHHQQGVTVQWQTDAGDTQLDIIPEKQGWRWQGKLPGQLLTPYLTQPLQVSGGWQPRQPLTLKVAGTLPTPLQGKWQLALNAKQTAQGWQLQPSSQLRVPQLTWQELTLSQLRFAPLTAVSLGQAWQGELSWQQGRWQQQTIPAASLQLQAKDLIANQGQMSLKLAPKVRLNGAWHYDQGLALTVPKQSLSAADVWSWLDEWLLLPVVMDMPAGQWQVALNAANVLDSKQPINIEAALSKGQLSYSDLLAEDLAAKFKLSWSEQGLRSVGPQGLSVAQLNVGIPITNIQGALRLQADGLWLSGLTAQVFDGYLALSPMALNATPQGEAHFSDISLEPLLNYASVDGLTGQGRLKGRLPFSFDQGLSVTKGRAESEQGWITYQASEQLQASGDANISLGLTLGLLSDLRYDRLGADISMARNGEAIINSHLYGQAPINGKLHPVNLNYHHQENLLQLLASLRFAQDLSEQLPAKLQRENNQ
ncbi:intermembrane phospholipid transport protein YdbH family protein [Oceanisphaera pacifica]|uniref:YdbH domain-containing protein n=1 Tax=Oceanisphaera pacifica TaxID=2818389 RepID=A0ABS3NH39_9GAMM|nr:YdbH domain-containing protein [Oceanisphaera pacifica]MBO1519600.1 YdbH domain-containing protein [Oceanisphaera pacifica]